MAETIRLVTRGAGPRQRNTTGKEPPRRTTLHEDDLHVGTIIEHHHVPSKGVRSQSFCSWYTASDAGQSHDYATAYHHIVSNLRR